jgi:uncharacterized protein YdcH (DUF465 family)
VPIPSEDLRLSLLARDPEYRSLFEEHTRCDSELEQIIHATYINSEDLIQEAELKKQKLYLKDRMEFIRIRYCQTESQTSH